MEAQNLLSRANQAYELTDGKATSNAFMQGISGIFGFFVTIPTDIYVVLKIYHPMWNEIRKIYNHGPLDKGSVKTVLSQIWPEILADIAFDKVLGNVPVVGIYFNAICGKALTWRLGTLFAFMSSRGPEVPEERAKEAMILIRHLFPQKDLFTFATPSRANFVKLVESVENKSINEFDEKVLKALDLMAGIS